MSTLKSSAEHLTLNADGSGNDIKFQSNATQVAAIDQSGNLTLSGTVDGVDIQTLNTTAGAALPKAGGTITGDVTFADGVYAKFGTGNDLRIRHDGSNSYIAEMGTGDLIVQTNGANFLVENTDGDNMVNAVSDGTVELYHNAVKKLETTATGVNVTGDQLRLTGSGSQTYVAALNTGSGEATFFMDASNGDLAGSDYAWIKQKNNLDVEIGSAASTNRHLLFSPDGSEKMRILGPSGEVLIGTTSQGRETDLAVVGPYQSPEGAWSQVGIYSNDSYAINKGGTMMFGGQDGLNVRSWFAGIKGAKENSTNQNYAGYLAFYTRPSGAVPVERMRISSSGIVTKPYQPGCSVGTSNGHGTGEVEWNHVNFNVGSHYNSSNGRFTCPVAGRYLVNLFCMSNASAATMDISVRINGSSTNIMVPYQSDTGAAYNQVSASNIFNLSASDYLSVWVNSGSIYGGGNGRHGGFSVQLLA